MTVLVDINDQNWMTKQQFIESLNGGILESKLRFYPETGTAEDIAMLVCDRLRPGLVKQLPNLALIQKLGAGVETIVYDSDLPENIRVTRLKPEIAAMEMARFCLAQVLPEVHHLAFHKQHQLNSKWMPKAPQQPSNISIGVLGLGHIGGTTARLFRSLAFHVIGWSRTAKAIDGVDCRWGLDAINGVLAECDYVICILPSTTDTFNLFDRHRFKSMKPGATIINIGRGTLIVEQDLIEALDNNCLAHAVLDVFQQEPLSEDSPLWAHPAVTITPHISGWHLQGLEVVADNYHALSNGSPLIHEVSRKLGY